MSRHLAFVFVVACVVLLTNLGGPRLWDRDEPRNAGCAAEMLERGDWVVPTFNQELRTHKPILLYWCMMLSYSVFGVNEFAARFPSAFFGVGTVLITYGIGRRLFQPAVGVWAAVILASTLMFDVAGRAATPDAVLIFFSTAAIGVYVWGAFPRRGLPPTASSGRDGELAAETSDPGKERLHFPTRWWTVVGMNACMGMAVLAKGPIGVVLPTAVIGLFLLVMWYPRSSEKAGVLRTWLVRPVGHFLRTCSRMRPITALAVVLVIALPWYILVGIQTDGAWLRGFFFEHNLGRAMQPMEGHDGSPLLFYPVALLVGFFPWSIFAAPVLVGVIARLRKREADDFAAYLFPACWVAVYLGLFSFAQTKLPSYITPCYPAVAVLTAGFLHAWIVGAAEQHRIWMRLAWGSVTLVGVAMVLGLGIAAWILLPSDVPIAAIGLVPLAAGIVAWRLAERGQRQRALVVYATSAVLLTSAAFAGVAQRVDRHQLRHQLLAEVERRSDNPALGGFGFLEPSWVFYARRPIAELTVRATPSETRGGADEPHWKKRTAVNVAHFLREHSEPFVITTVSQLDQLEKDLPPEFGEIARIPNFLKDDPVVLIGRTDVARTAARP